jgi:hypothetical protein
MLYRYIRVDFLWRRMTRKVRSEVARTRSHWTRGHIRGHIIVKCPDVSEEPIPSILGRRIVYATSKQLRPTHIGFTRVNLKQWICHIWGFHGGDYEECCLLGYIDPGCISQETHYISATESSQLMLCKIWGFHGGDYEECRLLGYKNPFRTSQETHYVSATERSRLMLCKTWGFHGGDYEECRPLGCYAVWFLQERTFRRTISPPLLGGKESAS